MVLRHDVEIRLYQAALKGYTLFVHIPGVFDPIAHATLSYRRRLAPVQPARVSEGLLTGSPPPTRVSQVKQLNGSSKSRLALWEICL